MQQIASLYTREIAYQKPLLSVEAEILSAIPGIFHRFGTCHAGCVSAEWAQAFNLQKDDIVVPVYSISDGYCAIVDADHKQNGRPRADALVTNSPNTYLSVYASDCVPILLAESSGKMVGAIHGGWLGLSCDIISNTVECFDRKGISPQNISAAIGPCIAPLNYPVKMTDHFYERLMLNDPSAEVHFQQNTHKDWFFDMAGYAKDLLKRAGVSNIQQLDLNTYDCCDEQGQPLFYSKRREYVENGNNASLIGIKALHLA